MGVPSLWPSQPSSSAPARDQPAAHDPPAHRPPLPVLLCPCGQCRPLSPRLQPLSLLPSRTPQRAHCGVGAFVSSGTRTPGPAQAAAGHRHRWVVPGRNLGAAARPGVLGTPLGGLPRAPTSFPLPLPRIHALCLLSPRWPPRSLSSTGPRPSGRQRTGDPPTAAGPSCVSGMYQPW